MVFIMNRFYLLGSTWAAAMIIGIGSTYRDKTLNTVHKFGHARLFAQAVTIVAVIGAFYFTESSDPNAQRSDRKKDSQYWQSPPQKIDE